MQIHDTIEFDQPKVVIVIGPSRRRAIFNAIRGNPNAIVLSTGRLWEGVTSDTYSYSSFCDAHTKPAQSSMKIIVLDDCEIDDHVLTECCSVRNDNTTIVICISSANAISHRLLLLSPLFIVTSDLTDTALTTLWTRLELSDRFPHLPDWLTWYAQNVRDTKLMVMQKIIK